ncbi:conserved domain protein [delta proteobacterium NaphS2]|nr:conserved domain protein [delta proteobacterium NaphS2]
MKKSGSQMDYEGILFNAINRLDAVNFALYSFDVLPTEGQLMGLQEIVEASVRDLRSIKDFIDGRILEVEQGVVS